VRKIILLIFVLAMSLFIGNVISVTDENGCTYKTILKCRESPKIAKAACDVVLGSAREYSLGCGTIDLRYNVNNLECGDELALKIGRYSSGGWQAIVNTYIQSNGDGTGIASADVNSGGIYAVIAEEACIKECIRNVYDVPDPVLIGGEVKLGVCGDKFKSLTKSCPDLKGTCCNKCEGDSYIGKTKDCQQNCCANGCEEIGESGIEYIYDFDNIAPVLFVIRRDESLAENQDLLGETECPKGYEFAGSFRHDDRSLLSDVECTCTSSSATAGGEFKCTDNTIARCGGEELCFGSSKKPYFPCKKDGIGSLSADNIYYDNKYYEKIESSLKAYGPDLKPRELKVGWVNLCTTKDSLKKEPLAYLEATRDDCIYEEGIVVPSVLPSSTEVIKCPRNSVVCAVTQTGFVSQKHRAFITSISCCKLNDIFIDTSDSGNIIFWDNFFPNYAVSNGDVYCTKDEEQKNLIANSAQFSAGFWVDPDGVDNSYEETSIYLTDFGCNKLTKANVGRAEKIITTDNANRVLIIYKEPNYAICGGKITSRASEDGSNNEPYFCPIEQNKLCKKGYELVGSIRVGSLDGNRCDANYAKILLNTEWGISADGKRIAAGLMGLCVKKQESIDDLSQTPDDMPFEGLAARFTALNLELGYADVADCPEGYHNIARIKGKGSDDDENLDFAYIGEAPLNKNIRYGELGLCVADSKPNTFFCSTKDFGVAPGSSCSETEYCKDEDGALECSFTETQEEGNFDYYAFVCDWFGCPSLNYRDGTNLYYGKGDFAVCSAETCGLLRPAELEPITPLPTEPTNTDCTDEDQDEFFAKSETCKDGKDCDDSNKEIKPGAEEKCGNAIDEDCSGKAEECSLCNATYADEDEDGTCSDADCDDKNATINPNAIDVCENGIDENCDDKDDFCIECSNGDLKACYPAKEDYFYTYHVTCSKDGIYGDCTADYELGLNPTYPRPGCKDNQKWPCPRQFGVCQGSITTCTNAEWPDCDYSSIEGYSLNEICNDNLDNDCDGSADEGCICNIEDTGDCGSIVGECKLGKQECIDNKWAICDYASSYYPKPEFANNKDDDCDGSIDEGILCGIKYKPGFNRKCGYSNVAPCSYGKQYCSNETFIGSTIFGMCENAVNPQNEACDDEDNDCDGSIDEGCSCDAEQTKKCGIGVGMCTYGKQECKDGLFTECKDAIQPKEELCSDNLDNDCDGSIDEGCPCIEPMTKKELTSRPCAKQEGVCKGLNQTCISGIFADCDYTGIISYEIIESKCNDNLDNDCDKKTDGEDLTACGSTSNVKCSDGTIIDNCSGSKLCTKDIQLEEKCEVCDGCDNEKEICKKGKCIELRAPKLKTSICGDGSCDAGETAESCARDCGVAAAEAVCGDGTCDAGETAESCAGDCEEGSLAWLVYLILIIILILAISGITYWGYKKKKQQGKRKETMPEFNSMLRPNEIRDVETPVELKKAELKGEEKANVQQLKDYVRRSMESGKKEEEVKNLCLKYGWSAEEVTGAIKSIKPDLSRRDALKKLYGYVNYQVYKGASESMIRAKLLKASWKKEDIEKAIASTKIHIKEVRVKAAMYNKRAEEEKWAERELEKRLSDKEKKKK